MGTPAYMAPEQARGEVDRVDERADVFALGSILCEVLTGEPAFLGRSSGEILRKAALGDLADAAGPARRLRGRRRADRAGQGLPGARGRGPPAARRRRGRAGHGLSRRRAGAAPRRRARPRRRGRPRRGGRPHRRRGQRARRVERRARRFQVGLAASLLVLTTAGGLDLHLPAPAAAAARRAVRPGARPRRRRCATRPAARPAIPAAWRDALAALERAEGQGPEVEALRDEIRGRPGGGRARRPAAAGAGRGPGQSTGRRRRGHRRRLRRGLPRRGAGPRRPRARRVRPPAEAAARGGRRSSCRPSSTTGRPCAARRGVPSPPGGSRWRRRGWPTRTRIATDSARSSWPRTASRRPRRSKALAAAPEAAELPAPTAVLLGQTLADVGQAEAAVALLRAAAGRHPGDVWVNYALAGALDRLRPSAREEAVRYYTAARALRPETATSWPTCSSGWAAAPRPRRSSAT